ncbi:MAG TPA: Xaa-Pro peptidase family protein [Gaiellaceae bacterium]|nr:Xaa-Pro peptidase family protein [Gaiellaceae bacterium]
MNVLMFADTVRSPELRHEIPHTVADPFLYGEVDGRRFAVIRSLEAARMNEVPGVEVVPLEELGYDELVAGGLSSGDVSLEISRRACERFGVRQAAVPPAFPVELADVLRAAGVELVVDRPVFERRRRIKSEAELAGIRRAQRAAEAATSAVAEILRASQIDGDRVLFEGKVLTSERLKAAVAAAFAANDAGADEFIVAHGPQTCIGHHMGSGPIGVGEPITVDLWPRDRESACFTDMTRTFVVGPVNDELRRYHDLCKRALEASMAAIRPGARTADVHRAAAEVFEAAGEPTLLSKQPGQVLLDGFFHSLGHGVGLEVHEEPHLGPGDGELVAGDVIAVEPGCYRQGFGGTRLEDLVLVTDSGPEVFTSYPYELEP